MKQTSLSVILKITVLVLFIIPMQAQTVTVYLKNVDENYSLLGGELSVYTADGIQQIGSNVSSGGYVFLSNNTTYQFRTEQQLLGNRKHHDWNSAPNKYLLRNNEYLNGNTTEWAKFHSYYNVTFTLNSNVPNASDWLEFKDPWWVENTSTNYQPDDFRSFTEMGISGSHRVFQNESIPSSPSAKPYYTVKAPSMVASTSGIYQFQSWNITGAIVQGDPAHSGEILYRAMEFNSSSVSIMANYTQVNNQAGIYTIPENEELEIPVGAVIECDPGFQLAVEGKLKAIGTTNNPITFKSASSTNKWQGIHMGPGYSTNPILEVELKYCRIEDAENGIEMSDNECIRKLTLDHTVFSNNQWNGIYYMWDRQFTSSVTMDINITNCTFDNSGFGNIILDQDLGLGSGPDVSNYFVTLRNNIFSNGDVATFGVGTITEEYNDFFNSAYNLGGNISSTSITGDPLFINSQNGDYNLQPSSPAIDAGDPNSPLDPDGTSADMGAYYYDAPPATPTGFTISGSVGQHPTGSWAPNSELDLAGYKLYKNEANSGWVLLQTLDKNTTSYTDNSVTIGPGGRFSSNVCYRVAAFDEAGQESSNSIPRCKPLGSVSKEMENIPEEYALHAAFPNPFNPTTSIRFDLPERSRVTMVIYDVLGNEIKKLVSGELVSGYHKAIWDGKDDNGSPLPSGMYIYRFSAISEDSGKRFNKSNKLVLMK